MRDRTEDIAELSRAFLVKYAGAAQLRSPSKGALELLELYH